MPSELTVIVKNSEKTQRIKHLIYDKYEASADNEVIKQLVHDAVSQFKDEVDSIKVRINLEVQ